MKLLAAILIFAGQFVHADGRAVAICENVLTSEARRRADPEARTKFSAEFAELIFADILQNQNWIDDALNYSNQDIHVMIEVAWLKKLNDKIFKNKDFVTALVNFFKQILLEEIGALRGQLKLAPYQDFKSTRLTFRGPMDSLTLARIAGAFKRANARFYEHPRIREVVRDGDLRASWFRMGLGQNEGEAALAARDARENGGVDGVSYFWAEETLVRFEKQLAQAKDLHAKISAKLQGTPLLIKERKNWALHIDVFNVIRKSPAKSIAAELKLLFPETTIDEATAKLLARYATVVDAFSPSILVAERELLTVRDAPHGALSLDLIGMGAENLRATARALIGAKNTKDAVVRLRASERKVTAKFDLLKQQIRATIDAFYGGGAKIRISGDDVIIIPDREITTRDQMYLTQNLARLSDRAFFRMSAIKARGANSDHSMELISHAESIEKILRKNLLRSLGPARANQIALQILIPWPDQKRNVFLMMSGKKSLEPFEKDIINHDFDRAVGEFEGTVEEQGLEYFPLDVFGIFGRQPRL